MKSRALCRAYSFRVLTSCIFGEITCAKLICLLATVVIAFSLLSGNSTTMLTSYSGLRLEIKDIEKEAINTILIENANGNFYIAFEMPNGSETFKKIKEGIAASGMLNISSSGTKLINKATLGVTVKDNSQGVEQQMIKMTGKAVPFVKSKAPIYPITINKNPYKINNKKICSIGKNLMFLVLVHSSTNHFSRRISIRETWANKKLFKNHDIRVVFLLGKPEKDSTQILIEHENYLYRDIVQGNFLDSYHNLTHKAVLGVRWVVEHCPNTKTIIKVDDDVFLNVFQIIKHTEDKWHNETKFIHCGVRNVNTSIIQRDKGKWKVEDIYFKNMTHYPVTYCNGFFVVMTSDIFPALYEAAKQTPFFWIDDVYLFGLLPARVGGVKFEGLQHLNLNENRALDCFESRDNKCQMLVAGASSEGVMDKLWYNALEHYKELAMKYSRDDLFFKDSILEFFNTKGNHT